ncbi:hypothetical protein PGTUg99_018407 [Puccinia graminis f. sp. tritici]|uniref:Uncharacterized protein n=1 Tax=Puccinia graminis f. sp. tritici TaxID=56615 RepID=A0A5B0RRA0_PUCGR|nr:hypothetical protein PGTUg99_018407 [Puccinia graminis f. sp. tritici]
MILEFQKQSFGLEPLNKSDCLLADPDLIQTEEFLPAPDLLAVSTSDSMMELSWDRVPQCFRCWTPMPSVAITPANTTACKRLPHQNLQPQLIPRLPAGMAHACGSKAPRTEMTLEAPVI